MIDEVKGWFLTVYKGSKERRQRGKENPKDLEAGCNTTRLVSE